MPKLRGLVLGAVDKIVRNGNTLRAMAKNGHFQYPVDNSNNPYVDELNNPRVFSYKGNQYEITYMDGCFFPFVLRKEN